MLGGAISACRTHDEASETLSWLLAVRLFGRNGAGIKPGIVIWLGGVPITGEDVTGEVTVADLE